MKKNNLSNRFIFSCLFLCLISSIYFLNAQSIKKVKNRPQIVLNVTSEKSNISVTFEFTLIKKGKRIKTEKLKTPFIKAFEQQDMIFLLSKISGKSNINYKVINIDGLNRELGCTILTAQSVKFNIVDGNVIAKTLK